MRHSKSSRRALGIGALATAVLGICAMADEPADPKVVDALVAAHNRERKREKLGPLKLSPLLCESARIHARDMARHHKLDHKGSDGSTTMDRVKRVGYNAVRGAENIAEGQTTVDEVMTTWMKSPGHRANILADYTEVGVALVEDDAGTNYWCVNFGIPIPRLKPDDAATRVVKEINRQRETGRKVVLEADRGLGRAAMAISAAMAAKDNLKTDSDPFKLIDERDLEGREIFLHMSANTPTPEEAAKVLLGAEPEKFDNCREIGIGYAQAKSGTPYWCAIFARPVGIRARLRPR